LTERIAGGNGIKKNNWGELIVCEWGEETIAALIVLVDVAWHDMVWHEMTLHDTAWL
jgi:hypothetical protein